MDIYDKYNIVHINGCRYYLVNLKEKEYNFEHTIPYCCVIEGVEIYDSAWKGMIEKVCLLLDEMHPKSIDALLSIRNSWGKQEVFSTTKKTNYTPFKGIYINTNHTAIHAMWTIQLLLNEYHENLDHCKFIIRRLPIAEPKEVKEYEKGRALNGFRAFMAEHYKKTDEFINKIIKNVEIINAKILPKFSVGYNDLFLIEAPNYFLNYMSKIIDYVKTNIIYNDSQRQIIEHTLNYLFKYIKIKHKEDKINFGLNNLSNNVDDMDDLLDDF